MHTTVHKKIGQYVVCAAHSECSVCYQNMVYGPSIHTCTLCNLYIYLVEGSSVGWDRGSIEGYVQCVAMSIGTVAEGL